MDTIDTLFKEFGHIIGLPDLSLDENGYCCLFFDEIVLNLEVDREALTLHFYANVGEIPDPVTTGFYEMLLEANFFYRGTGGASLGIDRAANLICLNHKIFVSGLTLQGLEKSVEDFVNVTESMTRKIADYCEARPETPGPAPGPDNLYLKV